MPNRLASSTSPYLLQHAENPVDWHEWGPEAFAEARRRDVPIFLSIGYSTCYWCHVMERESFESPSMGDLLSERFVCIKVDREEHPDVDEIYMAAVQITTGHGGWPMSVFLEPEKLRPFWCGTYIPPEPRHGLPAFSQVAQGISEMWGGRRDEIIEQSQAIAEAVAEHLSASGETAPLGSSTVVGGLQSLLSMVDPAHGGFGGPNAAPKFPQPAFLEFLLDARSAAGDESTRSAIDHALRLTLDAMLAGGINDHLAGGFHRYSVDAQWLVPHFEKMLYDQAQLVSVYARASRVYEDAEYARCARQTLDFVRASLTDARGAFHTALDAETNGREGVTYLWDPEQFDEVLNEEDADLARALYGLDDGPNFRDPHHPQEPMRNVLRLDARPDKIAAKHDLTPAELHARLDAINAKLLETRNQRTQPRLDDKVLASWNALMIAAMAEAATHLDHDTYLDAAEHAAAAIKSRLIDDSHTVARTFRGDTFDASQFDRPILEDAACVAHAFIALHRSLVAAGRESNWLREAESITARALALFSDDDNASLYDTTDARDDLFIRSRSTYDGAFPSATSVMLNVLINLHQLTDNPAYLDRAGKLLTSISAAIASSPLSTVNSTRALLRLPLPDGPDASAHHTPARGPDPETYPVQVFAAAERVVITEDMPAAFDIEIRIDDGYHIIAADPGTDAPLQPLRIGLVPGSGSGVRVFADYPEGEPLATALTGDASAPPRVQHGTTRIQVAIEQYGEWSGRPILGLTCQACSDTECLQPITLEFDIAIDQG